MNVSSVPLGLNEKMSATRVVIAAEFKQSIIAPAIAGLATMTLRVRMNL
jgi:hypothetical protein